VTLLTRGYFIDAWFNTIATVDRIIGDVRAYSISTGQRSALDEAAGRSAQALC